jgi:hypothetical protein
VQVDGVLSIVLVADEDVNDVTQVDIPHVPAQATSRHLGMGRRSKALNSSCSSSSSTLSIASHIQPESDAAC